MITNEKLHSNLPEEPGPLAVVIGEKTGMAYQRHDAAGVAQWLPPGLSISGLFGSPGYTWTHILAREGSVTVVWRPTDA